MAFEAKALGPDGAIHLSSEVEVPAGRWQPASRNPIFKALLGLKCDATYDDGGCAVAGVGAIRSTCREASEDRLQPSTNR